MAALSSKLVQLFSLTVLFLSARADNLPTAAIHKVEDTYFGVTVNDDYRYFEDVKNKEVAQWIKTHSDYAHNTLTHIGGRDAMLAELKKLESSVPGRVYSVTRTAGDKWFYENRGAQDNQFKLCMRVGLTGKEVVLVDPDKIAKRAGKPYAVNYFMPSPDGRYLAYGLSQQGSESASLYLMDLQTGRNIGKPFTRAEFGAPDWAPDSKSLNFVRLQEMKRGMQATDKFQKSAVWHVDLPSLKISAAPVFSLKSPGVAITPAEIPFTDTSPDGRWVFGIVVNGVQRELKVYATRASDLKAGKPLWRKLVGYQDEVTDVAYMNDKLYLLSHLKAPRSEIKLLDINAPDAGTSTLVAQGNRVITSIAPASDAIYIEARDGNIKRLSRLTYQNGAQQQDVKLPLEGTFNLDDMESNISAANPRFPGVVLDLQSWTQARQIYSITADGTVTNTGLQPRGLYDAPADIEAREVLVRSHDGAMVPLSIMYRKGTALDGRSPTLLYGYGAYGITEEPRFSLYRLAWINQGGVWAVANPRGSGVFGEEWYRGGYQETKPNTWKDFIACAEYLIAQGYTKPAKLGIYGGSAGGILVGRAMTERPDLFAAVVSAVGVNDTLRAEFTANGIPNIPEFGSVKTEAGFKGLLAMSTLANVKDHTAYPALLVYGGFNDPRVEIWHSAKLAARVLAANDSGKPVLLRVDYDAGHGIGATKQQQLEERADVFSFLLWQFGQPGYALRP
ncbi:prolyl oligopeptidase family serine peptidase [Duganella sp. FT80W]|uniref:prolyl oligopeptidase n=1 Tax=Duganella guangzhouensis TaxID=2666084 RepID=A0A6I2L2S6_9BURK|nr:prolyl oligopeptidase family serine peptidase [Duganella guangzhouensis]MRW91527.1 prolyl oligopeptidase family serine peptidase [Duganella guangzhouensis]